MRTKRAMLWIGGVIAALIGLPFGYYHLILDWQGRPYCHKQVYTAFRLWMDDAKTNAFPNIEGSSWNSLVEIREEMNGMDWAKHYRYVPGLREDDPGDLVLMYLDCPTRWAWHGGPPTIFKEKAWILVPVDFGLDLDRRRGPGECSERVSFDEFRSRLERTLAFVRTNDRPNWRTVVADHTKFLDSIKRVDR
jgi:hypothetical protein